MRHLLSRQLHLPAPATSVHPFHPAPLQTAERAVLAAWCCVLHHLQPLRTLRSGGEATGVQEEEEEEELPHQQLQAHAPQKQTRGLLTTANGLGQFVGRARLVFHG